MGKVHVHSLAMKAYWWSIGIAPRSELDGDKWSASRPGSFSPREKVAGTHWIGCWVGPRSGGEMRNAYELLFSKSEGKRPLGRRRRRWENNIRMDGKVWTGFMWPRIGTSG
jgi:hypothetical protein